MKCEAWTMEEPGAGSSVCCCCFYLCLCLKTLFEPYATSELVKKKHQQFNLGIMLTPGLVSHTHQLIWVYGPSTSQPVPLGTNHLGPIIHGVSIILSSILSSVFDTICVLSPFSILGPAYDLSFSEIRGQSLVILWKAPIYTGASAVTGYFVDMAKKGSSEFTTLNQEAVSHRYLQVEELMHDVIIKIHSPPSTHPQTSSCVTSCGDPLQVTGLEEGESYVFRVRAENANGTGKPSQLSEPVCAKALPGNNSSTHKLYCSLCWIHSAPHLLY